MVKASVTDTIYIYETVHVTDTVWLDTPAKRDTIRIQQLESIKCVTLLIDTIKENALLIYFSPEKSATIPINRIYVNRNQLNQTKMKKAGFFTLMFLAFQSISFAQPELSVKAGISEFWYMPFDNMGIGPIFGDHQGFEIKGPIMDSNVSFAIGYEVHGFGKNIQMDILEITGEAYVQDNFVQENHRSIPILFYYQYNRLDFFAGYEYRFVNYSYQIINNGENSYYSNYRNEHGFTTGLEYNINQHLALVGKFYFGDAFVKNKINNGYHVKNGTSLDLSLKYYLNRTREFKKKF